MEFERTPVTRNLQQVMNRAEFDPRPAIKLFKRFMEIVNENASMQEFVEYMEEREKTELSNSMDVNTVHVRDQNGLEKSYIPQNILALPGDLWRTWVPSCDIISLHVPHPNEQPYAPFEPLWIDHATKLGWSVQKHVFWTASSVFYSPVQNDPIGIYYPTKWPEKSTELQVGSVAKVYMTFVHAFQRWLDLGKKIVFEIRNPAVFDIPWFRNQIPNPNLKLIWCNQKKNFALSFPSSSYSYGQYCESIGEKRLKYYNDTTYFHTPDNPSARVDKIDPFNRIPGIQPDAQTSYNILFEDTHTSPPVTNEANVPLSSERIVSVDPLDPSISGVVSPKDVLTLSGNNLSKNTGLQKQDGMGTSPPPSTHTCSNGFVVRAVLWPESTKIVVHPISL